MIVRIGFIVICIGGGAVQIKRDGFLNWCRWAAKSSGGELIVSPLIRMGEYIRANSDENAVVAGSEAGVVPYYSHRQFIDMLGLVDRHIASLPGGLHEKTDADYVLKREPEFILIQYTELNGQDQPTWLPGKSLHEHPDFAENYEEAHREPRLLNDNAENWGLQPGWLLLYKRKQLKTG